MPSSRPSGLMAPASSPTLAASPMLQHSRARRRPRLMFAPTPTLCLRKVASSVRMRVTAYRTMHPDADAGLPFAIVPFAVDFLSAKSVATLIATIRVAESECGEKAVLIVIDTFARAIPGGNENDAQDVG